MLSSFLEKFWLRDCGLISPCFQFLDCSQDGSWWRPGIWWWQPSLVLPLVSRTPLYWLACGRLLCWLVHSYPALRCLYRWSQRKSPMSLLVLSFIFRESATSCWRASSAPTSVLSTWWREHRSEMLSNKPWCTSELDLTPRARCQQINTDMYNILQCDIY